MADAIKAAKRDKAKAEREKLEAAFLKQVRAAGIPEPRKQFVLRDIYDVEKDGPLDRGFAFDFGWVRPRLLVEIQGGTWMARRVPCKRCQFVTTIRVGGAHNSGTGVNRDADKAAVAAAHGYRLLTFTTNHIEDETAIPWLRMALRAGGWEPSATE